MLLYERDYFFDSWLRKVSKLEAMKMNVATPHNCQNFSNHHGRIIGLFALSKISKICSAFAFSIACCLAPLSAHAAKVFMLGGSVLNSNNEVYAGLRAATERDWNPDTDHLENCSTNWSLTTCPRIAVITSSAESSDAGDDVFRNDHPQNNDLGYYHLFQKYGFSPKHISAHINNFSTDSYAGNEAGDRNIDIVERADVVFFNGGDQARSVRTLLTSTGDDTPLMAAIRRRVNDGSLIIAGTSAGTAIQGNVVYGEGSSYGYIYFNGNLAEKAVNSETGLKDDVSGRNVLAYSENGGKMMGLGFAGPNIAVDTHCNTRGRVARNLAAMKSLEATQGICVDEDTAIYLDGHVGTVFGSNGVTIADTSSAVFSEGAHFKVSGAKLTYLTSGDQFDFQSKAVHSSKTLITMPYYDDTEYQSDNILGTNEITRSITYVVDSAAPYILGKAPAPVRRSGTSYGQEAQTFSFKFYRNEQTAGYFRDGAYTAVDVLIDIY